MRKLRRLLMRLYQKCRIILYRIFSDGSCSVNNATISQPVLITGNGSIALYACSLGYYPSPLFLSAYIHLEARSSTARIIIEDGVFINNGAAVIAEGSTIRIGRNTLIGTECAIYDSDFHDIHPDKRTKGTHQCLPVTIGDNVFIGSHVKILKGVSIGENSVISAGSVVTNNIPANVIAGGVPARVIKPIDFS